MTSPTHNDATFDATFEAHWQTQATALAEQAARHNHVWSACWESLDKTQQHALKTVLCLSEYFATTMIRQFEYTHDALLKNAFDHAFEHAHVHRLFDEIVASNAHNSELDEAELCRALRVLRQRCMLHIIWRDALKIGTTMETTKSLSALADVSILTARKYSDMALRARFGIPVCKHSQTPQHLMIIAMGKLGAHELNLSSDIDLIFCYPQSGNTCTDTTPNARSISNQEYFIKLGQKIIQALDNNTADGFVFRTDMRLRPYGQSGPLVMNFASLESYYHEQGRDWERFAMIKARVVGDENSTDAQELLSILRPFSYRAYVDFGAIESLRKLKAMIEAEVRRNHLDDNIKLGRGGIREIEFIVQSFQLIRGGQDKHLQQRELLTILELLEQDGHLPSHVCHELRDAYIFLRNTEHAIQAINDEQTQQLPSTELNQWRVASSLQCHDWQDFSAKLQQHRDKVATHFSRIVAKDNEPPEHAEHSNNQQHQSWEEYWLQLDDDHNALPDTDSQNSPLNQEQRDQYHAQWQAFKRSRLINTLQTEGRQRLDTLMPHLLAELWCNNPPLLTQARIIPLLEAIVRRSAYLVLLYEQPGALKHLLNLCAASPWVAEHIRQTPLLLDDLLNPPLLSEAPSPNELHQELYLQLLRCDEQDEEQHLEQLRYFLRTHKLRAATNELAGRLDVMQTSDYLTHLAEVLLDNVLQHSWRQMIAKYGQPTSADGSAVNEPELAIIGYGKMGGCELSYSSDLDLVFLNQCHPQGSTTGINGQRSIDNPVFYTRLGQRIIHMLSAQTRLGQLYEVDMRLRPSGSSGMIVTSVNAFAEYQRQNAWTWEHQALVRARPICGHTPTMDTFTRLRAQLLSQPKDTDAIASAIIEMRQKMRAHLGSKPTQTWFHLKYDDGGMVDIEFMVQYFVLVWSQTHDELLRATDNVSLLDTVATLGLIAPQDAQTLQATYLTYRAETHRRALQQQDIKIETEQLGALGFDDACLKVSKLWQQTFNT